MALVTCVECGKTFSDKAPACPVCACPTNYLLSQQTSQPKPCQNDKQAFTFSNENEFQIDSGVLVKYLGNADIIQIPFGVHTIGKEAFRCCRSIQIAILPKTVEVIETQAFEACINLKAVNIPTLVKAIPPHTFRNCRSLLSIVLPEGVEKIGAYAFARCWSLNKVYLPSTLVVVSRYAFSGCSFSKGEVYFNGTQKSFVNLLRQHTLLNNLYSVLCTDGLWDYFKDIEYGANDNYMENEDFPLYHCEMCGKQFVPALEHTYRDSEEDDGKGNFYCSWSCYKRRDDECCPECSKLFVVSRDSYGQRWGEYDSDYDAFFCSEECLQKAIERG